VDSIFTERIELRKDYHPELLPPGDRKYRVRIQLLKKSSGTTVFDHFAVQVCDSGKCRYPKIKFNGDLSESEGYIVSYFQRRTFDQLGRWVYYPWNNYLVHVLDEEVRINRNKYKKTDIQASSKTPHNGRPYFKTSVSEIESNKSNINKIINDRLLMTLRQSAHNALADKSLRKNISDASIEISK